MPVFPAALLPDTSCEVERRVLTDRERDDQAEELAAGKGMLKAGIRRQLLPRDLPPAFREALEQWYLPEIDSAVSMARVVELTGRLARRCLAAGIVIPAADHQVQEDDDDGPDYMYDSAGQLVPAVWTADGVLMPAALAITAASVAAVDHAAELSARGYTISDAAGEGQCQIVTRTLGPCCRAADGGIYGGARICGHHHDALDRPLIRRKRTA
ncbi:MAG: hypothetical protein ACLP52_31845 [Streptosporangiaceae bacterium]